MTTIARTARSMPASSVEAADRARPGATSRSGVILAWLERNDEGFTGHEIADYCGFRYAEHLINSRLADLKHGGLAFNPIAPGSTMPMQRPCRCRECTQHGRKTQMMVWRATPAGRAVQGGLGL